MNKYAFKLLFILIAYRIDYNATSYFTSHFDL